VLLDYYAAFLIVQDGRSLQPMEIKSAATFNKEFIANLARFCESEKEAKSPLLVYDGEDYAERQGVKCLNFRSLPESVGGCP